MGVRLLPAVLVAALLAVSAAGCSTADEDEPPPEDTTQAWRQLPDSPLSPRSDAVVVGLDDRVLVVGGWEFLCPPGAGCAAPEGPLLGDGAVYDARTDAWTTITPPPFGLLDLGAPATAGIDGTAYVLTACATGPTCDSPPRLLSYRLADDRWTDHGPVPGARYGGQLTTLGSTLLVSYSSDEDGEAVDVLFDPQQASWTELPGDPLPGVFDRFVVPVGDQLVVAGSSLAALGSGGNAPKLAARLDPGSGEWVALPDAPGPGFQLLPTDRGPLLTGHSPASSGWILDPGTWTWTALPALPALPDGHQDDLDGVLDRDGAVYDFYDMSEARLVYDSVTGEHVTVPPPTGRDDVSEDSDTALGRDLFVFGGQRWTGNGAGRLVGEAWLWTAPTG